MNDLEKTISTEKIEELYTEVKKLSVLMDRYIENYKTLFKKYFQALPRGSKPTENDLAILDSLGAEGTTAKDIQGKTGLPQPSISNALKRLCDFDLVRKQAYEGKGARYIYFKNYSEPL